MIEKYVGVRRFDRGQLQKPQRLDNGFLRVDAYLTRTGVFEYMNTDGSVRREYRPPEEVFHADALASLDRAPLTNNHPNEGFVSAKNRKRVSVGTTGGARVDGDKVAGSLQIEDEDAVRDVERGKQEISCGYTADLDDKSGVSPNGEKYDCIQRNIRYNHVALVDRGRAGPDVRVRMDNLDAELVPSRADGTLPNQEIHVDEIEIEVAGVKVKVPKTVAALHEKERADSADALKTEKSAHEATKAQLDAAKDALDKSKQAHADAIDPKRFDEAVKGRVALEGKAREVLGAEAKIEGTDRDIRVAVISKLTPSFKADGLSDEYVRARYDGALEFAAQSTVDGVRTATTYISVGQHQDGGDTWAAAQKAEEEFKKRNAEAFNAPSKK